MSEETRTSKSDFRSDGFGTFGYVVIGLCLALDAAMAFWHFHNRKWLGPAFNVDVEFVQAPDTALAGQAVRFTVHIEQDNKDTPLPGRIVNFAVSPPEKARILSASGASGTNYPKDAFQAQGKTDASGNVIVTVTPAEPGKYTLVALDSASEKEGTVKFYAVPPKG